LPKNVQAGVAEVEFTNKPNIPATGYLNRQTQQKSAKSLKFWQKQNAPYC
jgi:hypothetical protein